jgi:serine/threonine protein kinase
LPQSTRLASETLVRAYARKQALEEAGLGSTGVTAEIANLRSQLREGGDFRPGDVLHEGRYLILEKIGRGGFATVWRAHDSVAAREVAIKVLHASLADSPQRRSRFRRGAEVMALLNHPGIVSVLDPSGEEGGLPYFVMALVKGPNLQDAVLEGKIPRARALGIIAAVGEALSFAHRRGIVHRDVNPGNIFLDEDGSPRLSDFDLVLFEGAGSGTHTGALGTFAYAAPEMLDKPHEADQRVDVYSLAMTAIFCLRSAELPRTVYQDREPVIDALDCSDVVKRVLKRATSWDREARHASIASFCEALLGAPAEADDEAPITPTGSRIKPYAPAITPPSPDSAREGALSQLDFSPRPPRRVGAAMAAGATLLVGGFLVTRMVGNDWSRPNGNDVSTGSGRASASTGSGGAPPVVTASVAPLATRVLPPGHEGCPLGMVPVTSGRARASYCVDVTEVTVARYRACTDARACPPLTTRFTAFCNSDSDRALGEHPVNCVTFKEASAYCQSRRARLPEESEWVRAATVDDGRRFPWGNDLLPHPELRLNACDGKCAELFSRSGEARAPTLFDASDGWGATAPVGSYPAGDSPVGAHDLAGNVAEWTIGPNGPVVHGGSWHDSTADAVSAARGVDASPETRSAYIGFRCAADAPPRGGAAQGL